MVSGGGGEDGVGFGVGVEGMVALEGRFWGVEHAEDGCGVAGVCAFGGMAGGGVGG